MPRWWCVPFLWYVSADREVERLHGIVEPVKSHALLQHLSTVQLSSVTLEVPALATSHNNPLGDVDAIVPERIKTSFSTTSRMMVLAMLLLVSLMCILIDVIGRFLSHVADIVMDDCHAMSSAHDPLRQALEPQKELTALAFIRLVGAVHLVMYSYGPAWCAGFNQWGASWFSMYFILTGLGSAYVKLEKRVGSSWLPKWDSFLRHFALVYPLYLLALSWTLLNSHLLGPKEPLAFWNLLCEFSMLQAFLPQRMLHHYNPPSSFFSALALCWLLEEALYKLGNICWTCGKWARRFTISALLLWIILWPYGAPGKLIQRQDNVLALSFIHCYFSGVLLAHGLHEKAPVGKGRSAISASGAMLILATVFLGFSDPATATSWACFLLLPAQCLLVYGLGRGEDPLAKIFGAWPLPLFSELALGIYIFQTPAKQMLDVLLGWQGDYSLTQMAVLLFVLSLLAALAQLMQKPLARFITN